MRICLNCGKKNLAGFVFCQKCGAELAESSVAATALDPASSEPDAGGQLDSDDSDDAEEPLILLLEQGKKLEAIRLYRERTGTDLAAAKQAIERLQRQEAIETGDLEPQLVELLRRGQKIAAIKVYRAETGARLAEAKAAVEHVAAKHGLARRRSGCLGVLLLASAIAGGSLWW